MGSILASRLLNKTSHVVPPLLIFPLSHIVALSCNPYPLISTHIPFDPHSTSMLVPPSLSSGASRCSRGSTPHRSLVMLATALLHQDLSFYPSMVCWALALHTHTTWFPSPPSGAVLALQNRAPVSSLMSPASYWCTPPIPQTRSLHPPVWTRPCLLVHPRWTTGEILYHTHSTSTRIFTCRTFAAFNID